ncbi:MAG TPA: hypothetical protein VKB26_00170 [Candidatus Acidoferrales bacterium]|nr:hypothetical protein [Candidatus Acidoferrales bacterium]
MLNRLSQCLAVLALLALSAPVFARSMSQPLDLDQPATIGSTTLQPGHYDLQADPSSDQIRVLQNRKLVATVEGKIVTLAQKAPYGAVLFDGRKIHEIQFSGKAEAIDIPNS